VNTPKLIVVLLSLLLASCATSRPPPAQGDDLLRVVLFIEEGPDGALSHSSPTEPFRRPHQKTTRPRYRTTAEAAAASMMARSCE
jgi:hypothetical protein